MLVLVLVLVYTTWHVYPTYAASLSTGSRCLSKEYIFSALAAGVPLFYSDVQDLKLS